ncbi:MAG: hypothetical protein O2931_08630 [Planctomycetota bacterium]|nr:hypothetical protein [Planctomycetota bacterium]MDA1178846.1 hypothetical protein [Planctomycetota bacterium]
MKLYTLTQLLTMLALAIGCSTSPDTLVRGGYDEAEMAVAIERALAEVDIFIADLQSGRSEDYAVKAPVDVTAVKTSDLAANAATFTSPGSHKNNEKATLTKHATKQLTLELADLTGVKLRS